MDKYIKLENGLWGARIRRPFSNHSAKKGDKITVCTKKGALHSRTINQVISKEMLFSESMQMECFTGYFIVSLVKESFTKTSWDEDGKLVATY